MKIMFFAVFICLCLPAAAQYPSFKPLRYDDDFSSLKNDTAAGWYARLKYQSISKNNQWSLSFGGDIRYQYLYFKNEEWGDAPKDKNGFLLTRYLVHADLHTGKKIRTFMQLQSSLANGKAQPASPVDENQLDLHQAFIDLTVKHFTFRTGRQELLYGSQRLVAVREGPNNRQAFDAVRVLFKKNNYQADGFYSHYVKSRQQIFDDGFNKHTKFWGAYAVINKVPFVKNIDLYYLGLWKRSAGFDDGAGRELRHSFGTRLWNNGKKIRYDAEAVYQSGTFAGKPIHAYTVSINAGYKWIQFKSKPEFGIKAELISGDKIYADYLLQTFNPLFPRGGYFGLVSLIGPSNLMDIHPSFAATFTKKAVLNIDYDIFWRYSLADGIYGPNAILIYSGQGNSRKKIGNQLSADLVYTPNPFLYFRAEIAWFIAGPFIKTSGVGKDILFIAFTSQLRF